MSASHFLWCMQIRCSQITGARCVGVEINEERAAEARENIKAAGKWERTGQRPHISTMSTRPAMTSSCRM